MINLNRLNETDLFARFFLKLPGTSGLDGYYQTLFAAEPFLNTRAWQQAVTGYYLNVGNDNSLRISYFTDKANIPTQVLTNFLAKNPLEYIQKPEKPNQKTVSALYGEEELRFRRFLTTYTLIGLDIMKADLLHARCLFATFRFQVMLQRQPYRPHFESIFLQHSPSYSSLSAEQLNQFWGDMSNWPNLQQVDWAHMFVNMVLGRDWRIGVFLNPQPALTYKQINDILLKNQMGFQIPDNWTPTI
jgi:hypothetical protein